MIIDNISLESILISLAILIIAFVIIKLIERVISHFIKIKVERMIHMVDQKDMSEITIPVKPCPFCGKNVADVFVDEVDGEKLYSIICDISHKGCGCATGIYDTPLDALAAWNARSYFDD